MCYVYHPVCSFSPLLLLRELSGIVALLDARLAAAEVKANKAESDRQTLLDQVRSDSTVHIPDVSCLVFTCLVFSLSFLPMVFL